MTDPDRIQSADAALAAFWAHDEPPARDPVFEAAAMARVNRRRWRVEAGEIVALAVPALAILWAAWPTLLAAAPQLLRLIAAWGPLALCIGAVALVAWTTREVFAPDL